jgi:hypothetical protein
MNMLSREVPPDGMVIGEKPLLMSAGSATTGVEVTVDDGVNVIVGG